MAELPAMRQACQKLPKREGKVSREVLSPCGSRRKNFAFLSAPETPRPRLPPKSLRHKGFGLRKGARGLRAGLRGWFGRLAGPGWPRYQGKPFYLPQAPPGLLAPPHPPHARARNLGARAQRPVHAREGVCVSACGARVCGVTSHKSDYV